MGSGWINGRDGTRLARVVVELYGATCWLCLERIDLTIPRTHALGLTIDHTIPRVRLRHLAPAERRHLERDPRYLRPAHKGCNSTRQDKPAPSRRPSTVDPDLARLTGLGSSSAGRPGDPASDSLSYAPREKIAQ